MGSIYNRGTRDKPNWYISYTDVDGNRKAKASKQPTKTLARKYLAQFESRIASGKVGIKEAKPSPRCKALMTTWSEGLTNRYAKGDQGRAKKHLIPVFGRFTIERVDLARIMQCSPALLGDVYRSLFEDRSAVKRRKGGVEGGE